MISYMLVYHPKPVGSIIKLNELDFIFGYQKHDENFWSLNFILLITRSYIFHCSKYKHDVNIYHLQNLIKEKYLVISTFKFGYPRLTLKEGPKVKSGHARRFPAHDFLYVGLPSKTSRINNKRVISTFKFGYLRLTLKEGSKVNSDNIRRFAAHDFL